MKQTEKGFYSEVAKQISMYDERHNFDAVIIASPAFFKDEVAKDWAEKIRGSVCHAQLISQEERHR